VSNITPQKLYKYQPFNLYNLVNLIRRELYFSKPESLNDPYDCDPPFEITKAHRTQKNIKLLFDKIRSYEIGKSGIDSSAFDALYLTDGNPNKRFERDFIDNPNSIREQIKSRVGVTCFSKYPDNFLLWSHYTDKHQSFCLEFDTSILQQDYPGTIIYEIDYPKLNKIIRFDIVDVLNNSERMLELLLTRKSYSWRYEEEYRIFSNKGGNIAFNYNQKALTGIYFGYNMREDHKDVLISILADSSKQPTTPDLSIIPKNYPNIQIVGTQIFAYNMELTRNIFKVKPFPFRPRVK
jgi:Protein of unknown function (DUF2971)